jgi:hypothetical protein
MKYREEKTWDNSRWLKICATGGDKALPKMEGYRIKYLK